MFVRKINRNLRAAVQIFQLSTMSVSEDRETNMTTIKEGMAVMRLSTDKVFYNPVQEFNRDLSIAVLSVFSMEYLEQKLEKSQSQPNKQSKDSEQGEDKEKEEVLLTILEPLSATGLRAIRYAKEIPNVAKVVANDISPEAVEVIKENILLNNMQDRIVANNDDACILMLKHKRRQDRFGAIDLDPYGCPSKFLDGAVQAIQDGGLLAVTATDMAVLAGNCPETCYSKYGANSLKSKACHELALRILLQNIESHANRHGRHIVPLLSVSADFYIRVFVKVYTSQETVKKATSKLSLVYQCVGCGTMTLHQLGDFVPNPTPKRPQQMKPILPTGPPVGMHCVHCNSKHRIGGPIWSAPIHDQEFVSRVLTHVWSCPSNFGTGKRLEGVLSMIKEELPVPLYYTVEQLTGTVHVETMKMNLLRSVIINAGFEVSYSHAWKNSVKTNAPARFMWDVVRSWAKQHPVKKERMEHDPIVRHLLSQEIQYEIDWTSHPEANPPSRRDQCLRFQTNPLPFWGPGSRSLVNIGLKNHKKQLAIQKEKSKLKRKRSPPSEYASKKMDVAVEDNSPTQFIVESIHNTQFIVEEMVTNENETK